MNVLLVNRQLALIFQKEHSQPSTLIIRMMELETSLGTLSVRDWTIWDCYGSTRLTNFIVIIGWSGHHRSCIYNHILNITFTHWQQEVSHRPNSSDLRIQKWRRTWFWLSSSLLFFPFGHFPFSFRPRARPPTRHCCTSPWAGYSFHSYLQKSAAWSSLITFRSLYSFYTIETKLVFHF